MPNWYSNLPQDDFIDPRDYGMVTDHNQSWWNIGHARITNGDDEMVDKREGQTEFLWIIRNDGSFDERPHTPMNKWGDLPEHQDQWEEDFDHGNIAASGRVNMGDKTISFQFGDKSSSPARKKYILRQAVEILKRRYGDFAIYYFA